MQVHGLCGHMEKLEMENMETGNGNWKLKMESGKWKLEIQSYTVNTQN